MKAALAAWGLIGLLSVAQARAENAANCASVPAYLLTTESVLSKVAEEVKSRKRLDVLVVGSGSSSLNGADGTSMSYPARLEVSLREKLPSVMVNIKTEIRPKKTAVEVAKGLVPLVEKSAPETKPSLVIWQTGTVDAMRAIDPDDFRTALDEGIIALQETGSDVLLINLQYSPRMETMLSVTPYNDTMRVVAQKHDVPIFDRFSIMRYWSDAGDFDPFGAVHGFGMAKRVHDCIGHALAAMIVEAAHINPAQFGIQR